MEKDFDAWNIKKQELDRLKPNPDFFYYEREVWWCSVGLNIGVESNGKNQHFERPVLVVKKFNGHMFWGVPLTSKRRTEEHFCEILHEGGVSWVFLSQIKNMSTKRMLRKIGSISVPQFNQVLEKIAAYIKKSDPVSKESSEAEATNKSILS